MKKCDCPPMLKHKIKMIACKNIPPLETKFPYKYPTITKGLKQIGTTETWKNPRQC
jgi:hypothetical protein